MYSKIKISGTIEVVTGLHIGGGGESSMIEQLIPVVRDLQKPFQSYQNILA